jgi:hypothetical protein
MVGRSALGGENARDSGRVAGIGAESVDSFRRKRDQLAGNEARDGGVDSGGLACVRERHAAILPVMAEVMGPRRVSA